MNLPHLHLLLNHFPTVGFAIGFALFIVAIVRRNEDMTRASLGVFVMLALMSIPAYATGNAAQTAIAGSEGVSDPLIAAHQDAALLAFVFIQFTGLFAWIGLWQSSRTQTPARWNVALVLLSSLFTGALMANAATVGGEIRHPEIASAQDAQVDAVTTTGWFRSSAVASFVIEYAWVWSVCETLHFIGLALLFSVVVINLRMLGMMKAVPFEALHRLLPWAILGFTINAITGMLFFIAAADQYTGNPAFYWKMLFMLLSGANVLYLTVSKNAAAVRPGKEAPLETKFIAAWGIFLWFGVVFWGRLMPFLGLTFQK